MKQEFNKYCVEVMGYEQVQNPSTDFGMWVSNGGSGRWKYNPYDDLNQMAEVVEKLLQNISSPLNSMVNQPRILEQMYYTITLGSIKQAFRDFIISTKEKDNEN